MEDFWYYDLYLLVEEGLMFNDVLICMFVGEEIFYDWEVIVVWVFIEDSVDIEIVLDIILFDLDVIEGDVSDVELINKNDGEDCDDEFMICLCGCYFRICFYFWEDYENLILIVLSYNFVYLVWLCIYEVISEDCFFVCYEVMNLMGIGWCLVLDLRVNVIFVEDVDGMICEIIWLMFSYFVVGWMFVSWKEVVYEVKIL